MLSRVLVVALMLCPSAGALAAPKFFGWSRSGALWFQQLDGGALEVCRDDPSDKPTEWPEGVNIGPGIACADLPDTVNGKKALDYVRGELKGARGAAKSPLGVEVMLESADGTHSVWVRNGPDRKELLGQRKGPSARLGDVTWREDGRAVAVVLAVEGPGGPSALFVRNVDKLLVGGPAGRKLAERLSAQAQGLMSKRDWSGAGRAYEAAIAADPDYAPARYGRAAAEAQGGVGRSAMIENLTWLKDNAEKDKAAKKLLDEAKRDAAFDAWVGEPEVRELLGLPKVSTMDVAARLLERKATWSIQGSTCKSPWLTLAFKGDAKASAKGGAVTLTVAESCKGKKTQKTAAGVWRPNAAGAFVVEVKKLPDGVTFPTLATLQLDESYQQLKLIPEAGDALGTFEPGGARLDDSLL